MKMTLKQLKSLISEAYIEVPDFDEDEALEVLAKIFNRAKFLNLEPSSHHSSTNWNGWEFFSRDIPSYRADIYQSALMNDARTWISEHHLERVIRIGKDNDWIVWPSTYLPNGNRIRSIARKYSGNDPRITKPVVLPYTGLKIDSNIAVDYVGNDSHVTIPEGVTQINYGVFKGHKELKEVDIPSTLKVIGSNAFQDTGIESIVLPDGLEKVHYDAFKDCTSLTSINIPKTVTMWASTALHGCTSLSSVSVSDVTELDGDSFKDCGLIEPIYDETKTILCRVPTSLSGEFIVPSTVTEIKACAFENCSKITSVIIPDGVTFIGVSAFDDCSSLQSIQIPKSVKTIKGYAFANCTSLTSINIPVGITNIDSYLFKGCISLRSVTIPSSVEKIDMDAFYNCSSLKSITIPNGVDTISYEVFSGCTALSSIVIPATVKLMSSEIFENCSSLVSVTFNNNPKIIPYRLFFNCTSLSSITIPSSVETINDYAFDGCTSLKSITIPDTVSEIGWSAFENCSNLSKVRLPAGLFETIIKNPDKSFKGTPWAEKVKKGEILFDVGDDGVLDEYKGHDSIITIPDEVDVIGAGAFFGNNFIKSVTIPDTVSTIESGAFENCDELEVIVLGAGIKKIEKDAFKNVSKKITVRVPDFDMCKLLIESGLPDSATIIVGKGKSRRKVMWDPED